MCVWNLHCGYVPTTVWQAILSLLATQLKMKFQWYWTRASVFNHWLCLEGNWRLKKKKEQILPIYQRLDWKITFLKWKKNVTHWYFAILCDKSRFVATISLLQVFMSRGWNFFPYYWTCTGKILWFISIHIKWLYFRQNCWVWWVQMWFAK